MEVIFYSLTRLQYLQFLTFPYCLLKLLLQFLQLRHTAIGQLLVLLQLCVQRLKLIRELRAKCALIFQKYTFICISNISIPYFKAHVKHYLLYVEGNLTTR